MKTNDLIEILAKGAGPAPTGVVARRLTPAVALGLLASIALSLSLMGPISPEMLATPAPWIKLAYAGLAAAGSLWLASRLSRPVANVTGPLCSLIAILLAMALLGAASLLLVPSGTRLTTLLGQTWSACPWNVLGLSLPSLLVTFAAMRHLAPTRLVYSGLAVGLASGAVGAFGYSMACPEVSPAFVAVWYTLGIALTALLGAALGPRVLRW